MNPDGLWGYGLAPGAFCNFPGNGYSHEAPRTHKIQKGEQHSFINTSSLVALKFDKGVVMAADTLGSHGSLARYRNCPRLLKVNDNILLGCGGNYADFQYLKTIIQQKVFDEQCIGDGFHLKPRSLYSWLTRMLFKKRSMLDPLWSNYIVAGIQTDHTVSSNSACDCDPCMDGEPFLGTVDLRGTAYEDATIATGMGVYIATPLLRSAREHTTPLDEENAKEIVTKCMEVLYYRDARAFQRYQLGVVTAGRVQVSDPVELKPNWSIAHSIKMT